ncbi:beta-2 adrenergic receptor-like, partial [Diaphorina citri]|uniref:Beta-2 adrenergic receptor-like n=1 Tax=Diaphorina citri TaxID=121845 RepID=A0A1S3DDK6_DIACI
MNHETSRVNINFTTEASTTDILVSNTSSLNYALVPPNHYQLLLLLVITLLLAGCIIFSNSVIIAAMFRYKRLRTASNYFIMSLALSDLWTGIFLPICVFLQNTIITWLCILPYCIIIVLVTASVLVMTAIAVDRFTSLVQPLRYNNLITHSSVERYIASFWIYSCIIGTTPIIYIQCYVVKEDFHDTQCSFYNIIDKTLQTFLFFTVYGPCSVILL